MPDWTRSMKQTYRFAIIDPVTWGIIGYRTDITDCSIKYSTSSDTISSADISIVGESSEQYIQVYLVTEQDNIEEETCLGTFLFQGSSASFDGKISTISLSGYSPLTELKETMPPVGYYVGYKTNIMNYVNDILDSYMRAPSIAQTCDKTASSTIVAESDDTWFSFITTLLDQIDYEFTITAEGVVSTREIPTFAKMQPVWVYTDDNSSILYPSASNDNDLYSIPNVYEVITTGTSGEAIDVVVTNDDPNSPTSTVSRGREIRTRDTSPSISGDVNETSVTEYAKKALKNASSLQHTVTYTHGYCRVEVGDCVMLNYTRAGLSMVKAYVTEQSIKCETPCSVEETAVYTETLWGD